MKKISAIITAGGYATRLKINQPKAALKYNNRSLLYWSCHNLLEAGIAEIFVIVNHEHWASHYKKELSPTFRPTIIVDKGYQNTFLLFKDYSHLCDNCLFTYGHSPRPIDIYRQLIHSEAPLNISYIETTSKRNPICVNEIFFAEPPYFISLKRVNLIDANSWEEFFKLNSSLIAPSAKLNIGEFNWPSEWEKWKLHIHNMMEL